MTQQIISNQQKVDDETLAEFVRNSLPSHWQEVRVGDICDIKTSFPSFNLLEKLDTKCDADELVLALKVSDMNSPANQRYLTEAKLDFRYSREEIKKGRFLRPGSIIFPKRGGAIGTNKKRMTKYYSLLDPNLIGIEPSNAVDGEYLLGFFERFDLRSLQDNNPIPQLNKNDVETIILPLPPLSEQRTIAKVLQAIQEAIQSRQDELKLESEHKAALMEYLFTHGTGGKQSKKTEMGEIPEGWKVVELGEIITLHRGYDLPTKDRKLGTVPIISSSGVSGTHLEAKVTAPGVVTGRYGTLGEVFYIEQDFWPLNTTLYVSEFRNVTPHFVAYLLRTLNFAAFNDKSSVPGVNRNDLHRIKIVLPDPSEQQNIYDVLSAYDTKISALEQETSLLEELFRTLLEELMTGRLSTLPLIAEGETHE